MSKRFEEINLFPEFKREVQLLVFNTKDLDLEIKLPWPDFKAGHPAINETLESLDGNLLGIDLEFDTKSKRCSILGIANNNLCSSASFDKPLAKKIVEGALKGDYKLVGFSVMGAEKDILEHNLNMKLPHEIFEDTMILFHLANSHLCKTGGQKSDYEKGSLGFINLYTCATMYCDFPNWKMCRGDYCSGPCPRCLRGEAKVYLENGSVERIENLVKNRYKGKVRSIDKSGNIVYRRVTNWFKNLRGNRNFVRVNFEFARKQNKGVVVTEDHEFLTQYGVYLEAKDVNGVEIATGTPALTSRQDSVIAGVLLGDTYLDKKGKIHFCHGLEQEEYIKLKQQLFDNISLPLRKDTTKYTFEITTIPQTRKIEKDFRANWKAFLEEKFSWESLMIWYLDDGSYHKYQMTISVKSYTEEERDYLCDLIYRKVGIKAYHLSGNIIFNAENAKIFSQLIYKYVPLTMKYKLREEFRREVFDPFIFINDKEIPTFYSKAIVSKASPRKGQSGNDCDLHVFCLEIEETNNFVTVGGTVHNCDVFFYNAVDAYAGLEAFNKLIDETSSLGLKHEFIGIRVTLAYIAQQMQNNGINVDRKLAQELDQFTLEEKDLLFKPTEEMDIPFNPQSPAEAMEYFKDEGIKLKNCSKPHLQEVIKKMASKEDMDYDEFLLSIEDQPIPVQWLIKFVQFKGLGKGLKGWFADKYFDKNGLLHPRSNTTGTQTGRWSHSKPNYANMPGFKD